MSIQVIAQTNIFSSEKLKKRYEEPTTLLEICQDLSIDPTSHLVFVMCNDEKLKDTRQPIKDGDLILIKVIPTGDKPLTTAFDELGKFGNWAFEGAVDTFEGASDFLFDNDLGNFFDSGSGEWNLVIGAALIVVGISATAFGGGIVGIPMMYAGSAFLSNGSFAESDTDAGDPDVSLPEMKGVAYMKGGKTVIAPDADIPLILGRTRYYPPVVASPLLDMAPLGVRTFGLRTGDYPLYQSTLHLLGQADLQPIAGTYKFEDRALPAGTEVSASKDHYAYVGTYTASGTTLPPLKVSDNEPVELIVAKGMKGYYLHFGFGEFYSVKKDGTRLIPYVIMDISLLSVNEDTGAETYIGAYPRVTLLGGENTKAEVSVPNYASIDIYSQPGTMVTPPVTESNPKPKAYYVPGAAFDPDTTYMFRIQRWIDDPTKTWSDNPETYNANIIAYKNVVKLLGAR